MIFGFDLGIAGATYAIIISQFIAALWLLNYFFMPQIMVGLFNSDLILTEISIHGMRIYLVFFPLIGLKLAATSFYQACGKPKKAALIRLTRQVFFLIPLFMILPSFLGLDGIGLIGHIYRLGASFLTTKYSPYNMGFGQYQFLMQLYQQDGLSHEELTSRLHVDKSTTTSAIEKLHKEKYVTIQQQETAKRKYRIYLTPDARDKQNDILQISQEWEDKMTACLSEGKKHVLYLLLKKIAFSDAAGKNRV